MSRSDGQSIAQPPDPPAGFDPERAFAGVHWHQTWEVFRGVATPGRNSVSRLCRRVQLSADLTGKRVLDIGAWNGGYSFECERRGAAEVVAYSLENPDVTGFNRLKALLGSRVRYVQGSRDGSHSQRRLRRGPDRDTYLDQPAFAACPVLGGRRFIWFGGPLSRQANLAPVQGIRVAPGDQSNWFGPNIKAVIESFETAGFSVQHLGSWDLGARSAFRAVAVPVPSRMRNGTYEGLSTFNAHLTGIDRKDAALFRRDGT